MTINKSMGYALAIIGVLVLSAGRVGAIGKHGGGHAHAGAKQSHGAKQHGAHNHKAASVHKNHAAGHKPTAHHGAGHKPQVQHNAKVTGIHQNHPGAHNTGTGLKHGHAGSWVPKPKATARQAVAAHAAHPKPGTALGLHRAANRMRPTDPNRLNHVSHNVRTQFAHNYRNFFTRTWWNNRFMANVANLRWYPHWWEHHNPHYWWRPATWGGFSQWIPGVAWSSPVVYEYGNRYTTGMTGST